MKRLGVFVFAIVVMTSTGCDVLSLLIPKLYFQDGPYAIHMANLDGSSNQVLVTFNVNTTIGSLLVVYKNNKLYWSEPETGKIKLNQFNTVVHK